MLGLSRESIARSTLFSGYLGKSGHLLSKTINFRAYEPGTACYNQILDTFGQDLKNPETDKIDRRKLGAKVFSNPDLLHKLESIVWPEILKQAKEKIEEFHQKGVKIVILDAAVLLQVSHATSPLEFIDKIFFIGWMG